MLSEEGPHTYGIGRRHGRIQDEQFSERDSNQHSIEKEKIQFDSTIKILFRRLLLLRKI
jgi:hypothetical protein